MKTTEVIDMFVDRKRYFNTKRSCCSHGHLSTMVPHWALKCAPAERRRAGSDGTVTG